MRKTLDARKLTPMTKMASSTYPDSPLNTDAEFARKQNGRVVEIARIGGLQFLSEAREPRVRAEAGRWIARIMNVVEATFAAM